MTFPLTNNWSRKDNVRLVVSYAFVVVCITAYIFIMMEWFVMPILDGWSLVIPELIGNDDSFLSRMVEKDVREVVAEQTIVMDNTDWKSLNDTQTAEKIDTILTDVTNIQEDLLFKLWGIILVIASPLIVIPLVLWVGFKIVIRIANWLPRVFRLMPKDNPPIVYRWRGKPLKMLKDDTLFRSPKEISKKFEKDDE